jgi:hypothetical protein
MTKEKRDMTLYLLRELQQLLASWEWELTNTEIETGKRAWPGPAPTALSYVICFLGGKGKIKTLNLDTHTSGT